MASGRCSGLELMERAGHSVVRAVLMHWPAFETTPQKAIILCDPGNNGGDGFVIAHLLRNRGWDVDVHFYGSIAALPADAKTNAERWMIDSCIKSFWDLPETAHGYDLCIDAVFGMDLKLQSWSIFRIG